MEHDIHTEYQYNCLSNNFRDPENTDRQIFQFCFTATIIILNCLIFIPVIANRRRFWQSYFYCLLGTVISSILFALIGMPVSILFGQEQNIILDAAGPCKAWHAISYFLWDASLFSIICMNLDSVISVMRPNIYRGKSYNLFMKILLISSSACSLAINIGLVCSSSLKIDPHTPFQPCLHVAKLEHLEVSFMWGMLFLVVSFALTYVLAGGENGLPSSQVDDKLTCYTLSLLLLDAFVLFLRVIPEIFHLILVLKPGIFVNPIDVKIVSEQLTFVTWMNLLILPILWMLDPTVRETVKMAFSWRVRRSREHEEILSSS